MSYQFYQILGLFFDILGVILLSIGGVFPVVAGFWSKGTQEINIKEHKRTIFARWGLVLAVLGFAFQIYATLLNK